MRRHLIFAAVACALMSFPTFGSLPDRPWPTFYPAAQVSGLVLVVVTGALAFSVRGRRNS